MILLLTRFSLIFLLFHYLRISLHISSHKYREWTTEKEINLFVDWNLSNYVYQTISGNEIKNGIEFKNGGGLFVSGSLSVPEDEMYEGKRTNFEFTTATLDLAKWGAFTIPPVGAGWFETIYLDDELRVDINSRNDILICTCE